MVGSLGQGRLCVLFSINQFEKIATIMVFNFLGKGSKPALCDQQERRVIERILDVQ
jgi:hypothetical protein